MIMTILSLLLAYANGSCLNERHNGNAMSFFLSLKNRSVHPIILPHGCCARYMPTIRKSRIVLMLVPLMILAVATAQAQTQRVAFSPVSQSIAGALYWTSSPAKVAYVPSSDMRNRGVRMVAFGGALQVAGVILVEVGRNESRNYNQRNPGVRHPNNNSGDLKMFAGVALVAAGTGVAIPGMVIWIRGAQKMKRAMELEQSVRLNISPMPSLIYRF